MIKFSANLSMLFTELNLVDRFKAAKQAGFDAVEIQFPYELSANEIKLQLQKNHLKLVLINIEVGDLLKGGEGLAAVPEKQQQFLCALEQCKSYAEILLPEAINVLPGRCMEQQRYSEYLTTFKKNLSLALDGFTPLGIKTVFEAINTDDMPGFLIHSGMQMTEIIDSINHPMLFMQYDVYHMHKMNENVQQFISQYSDRIGHIQFADVPGRGQPGTGVINFEQLFTDIQNTNYSAWVGAEYKPIGNTLNSLDWLRYKGTFNN
jgi:hydroxypyruvate isomerase